MPRTATDLKGKRFGKLLVISQASSKNGKITWLCECDCGTQKIIFSNCLKRGNTKSCGCLQREIASTHGGTNSLAYSSWQSIKQRCFNPKAPFAHLYLGRGITMCERWRTSFENFLEDMGARPSIAHSIDRIDNNGNYEPGNCRWSIQKQQMRNTSVTRFIEINGERMDMSTACEKYNINPGTLRKRLRTRQNKNWSIEDCFTKPVDVFFSRSGGKKP